MGISYFELIQVIGIFLEIIGFIFLLPKMKQRLEQKYLLLSACKTWRLKLGVWVQRNTIPIGIYFVIFGLFLQIISLFD